MSRRSTFKKHELVPDSKFKSEIVTRFVNCLMRGGKKGMAEKIFYDAIDIVEKKSEQPGITVFEQAISNTKPLLEVKSRRVGGVTYQVPVEVRPRRQLALAIRWIIEYAATRSDKSMEERLAAEFIDASKNEGSTIKKRADTHRMAEANRAFAHYRW